jgi:hypothetical protein
MSRLALDGDEDVMEWLRNHDTRPQLAPSGWPGQRFGLVCVRRRPALALVAAHVEATVVQSPAEMRQLGECDGVPKLWFRVLRLRLQEANTGDPYVFKDVDE